MKRALWLVLILGAAYGAHVLRAAMDPTPSCAEAKEGPVL